MNLVMIGRFRDAATAETVTEIIEKLQSALQAEADAGRLTIGEPSDRFSDEVRSLLEEIRIHNILPAELEQFLYDLTVRRNGDKVVITTDEIDVQALMKVMLAKGARVEVYSAHEHPDTDRETGA
ncbi:MAG: hypothetical protein EOP24_42585 [Hyphomicrobiales bacterium]|nr:MAG: hypothetical protein EOP24_42585 [Hyphomicrobiales bacterium]